MPSAGSIFANTASEFQRRSFPRKAAFCRAKRNVMLREGTKRAESVSPNQGGTASFSRPFEDGIFIFIRRFLNNG